MNLKKNDDTRKISAISKKLQPLGLYTPFKDISELKDNVSKILQAEVMNLIRKQGQVMPEIHKYIEISDTNDSITSKNGFAISLFYLLSESYLRIGD